jgi:N-acetylmuramoyl-L-alanine amidase
MVRAQPLVIIDIGHSAAAPGAKSARGVPEFEFNETLAVVIDSELRSQSFRTLIVNLQGDIESLEKRTLHTGDADMFLSVHHDSVRPEFVLGCASESGWRTSCAKFRGFSLFISRSNVASSTSLKCATAVGHALRNVGFPPSTYHASPILGENRLYADEANGVHYFDNLVVLRTARSPAILFEAGVIANRDEELALRDKSQQLHMAQAIAVGLNSCLRKP